ncbi:MAG: thermonuclease family protein, partial [Candidatus Omnitrophota bacterium]
MIKIAIGCLFVALALSACAQPADEVVLVTKVFDGDTLLLASGEKVRLIGIDCPEMYESDKLYRDARGAGEDITRIMEQGRKAWQFTRGLVEDKKVRLELDQERYDKYGRLLAYV